MAKKTNHNNTSTGNTNLQNQLWKIADELRGSMDANEFKNYILGFIFYKYLSEKIEKYNTVLLLEEKEGETNSKLPDNYRDLDDQVVEHFEFLNAVKELVIEDLGYNLMPNQLFSNIVKKGSEGRFILDTLSSTLKDIETSTMGAESEDDFNNLFEAVDLYSSKLGKSDSDKNKVIVKILSNLNEINFDIDNAESDILGDAYEYLIGQFASTAGKKAGEFYTPQSVSTILAKIVSFGKKKIKSAYDPTTGSASLLLRVTKEVEVGKIYGQEMNSTTFNLARMNMLLHDVYFSKFDIKNDDTLIHPQHLNQKFEAIVANPPFSNEWSPENISGDDRRFSEYGVLAPGSKADFAFVQHIVYQLDDNGTAAVVLPHGVLFRGGAEGIIRKYLVEEKNYLDAIIGLPSNIFYGTGIPSVILVFKKCRKDDDKVLFIDASNDFEKMDKNIIRPEDIAKIMEAYGNRKEVEKYSHLATLEEIKNNNFNLNIPRYINTFADEEVVDLSEVAEKIKNIKKDMSDIEYVINKYCEELGVEKLF